MTGGHRVKLLVLGCMLAAAIAGVMTAVHLLSPAAAAPDIAVRAASTARSGTSARPKTATPEGAAARATAHSPAARATASARAAGGTVAAHGGGPGSPVADLSRLTPVQEYN